MYPVLFTIGSIQIRSFGVFLLIGFLVAEYIIWRQGTKKGYNEEKLLDLGIICFIYAFLFARLGFVLLHYSQYLNAWWHVVFIWEGGLDFSFGLLGGLIGYYYFIRRNKWSFFEVGDFVALAFLVFYVIARFGSYLSGIEVSKGTYLLYPQVQLLVLYEIGALLVFLVFLIYFYRNKEAIVRSYRLTKIGQRVGRLNPFRLFMGRSLPIDTTALASVEATLTTKTQSILRVRSGGVFFLTLILLMITRLLFSIVSNVEGFSFIPNLFIIIASVVGLYLYRNDKLASVERLFQLMQGSVRYFKLARPSARTGDQIVSPLSVQEGVRLVDTVRHPSKRRSAKFKTRKPAK